MWGELILAVLSLSFFAPLVLFVIVVFSAPSDTITVDRRPLGEDTERTTQSTQTEKEFERYEDWERSESRISRKDEFDCIMSAACDDAPVCVLIGSNECKLMREGYELFAPHLETHNIFYVFIENAEIDKDFQEWGKLELPIIIKFGSNGHMIHKIEFRDHEIAKYFVGIETEAIDNTDEDNTDDSSIVKSTHGAGCSSDALKLD